MTFDAGTWWLIVLVLGLLIGGFTFLLKRTVFTRIDKCEERIDNCVSKVAHEKDITTCMGDIKQIREDYTPRSVHSKDFDECRTDIKKIKEDCITKEDFLREMGKFDRKLDRQDEKMDRQNDKIDRILNMFLGKRGINGE